MAILHLRNARKGALLLNSKLKKTTFDSTAVGEEFKTMAHQRHGNVAQACPGCHATNNFMTSVYAWWLRVRTNREVNLPGPDVVLESASTWAAIQTSMDLCANNGAVVVVARHYDAPEFNPVGQGYFGKRLQLLTVYGHPTPGSRWDMRTSYAHTLDLLSRGA